MSQYGNYGYLNGRLDQQLSDRRALRDCDDAIAEWMQYARQLEERLAQRDAELLAARTQRNVLGNYLIAQGMVDESINSQIKAEVDATLQPYGIYIQRNGTKQTVHRIRR